MVVAHPSAKQHLTQQTQPQAKQSAMLSNVERSRSSMTGPSTKATAPLSLYALATNDAAGLSELVRRADAGESIIDDSYLLEANDEISTEEKLERLAAMICQVGGQPETSAAALLVLMSTLENSSEPKVFANHVKHIAFTRCGELNCFGMVDAQIAAIESELLVN